MQLDAKDIIILVQFIVIVVGLFGLYRSVPPEFVRVILGFLESKAAETPDKSDDAIVAEARKMIEKLLPAGPVTNNVTVTPAAGTANTTVSNPIG